MPSHSIFIAALLCVSAATVSAQCTAIYEDGSADQGITTASAWASLTDFYNQSYCAPSWGSWFVHTYKVTVRVISPTGRVGYGYSETSASGGGGTGSAGASLPLIISDPGTYDMETIEEIDCTVAGAGFFFASNRRPLLAFGRAMTTFQFSGTYVPKQIGYDCLYNKTCSDSFNYCGSQQEVYPPNNAAQCTSYVATYWSFVKVGPLKWCNRISDPLTGAWITYLTSYIPCDGPLP